MRRACSWAAVCVAALSAGAASAWSQVPSAQEPSGKGGSGIPARFHGAGCNIKYAYVKPPASRAEDCVANRAGGKQDGQDGGDTFIRIRGDMVGGVQWACIVKAIRDVRQERLSFAGDCSREGNSFAATVTIILRPGGVVSVDTFSGENHENNDYRLQAGLR